MNLLLFSRQISRGVYSAQAPILLSNSRFLLFFLFFTINSISSSFGNDAPVNGHIISFWLSLNTTEVALGTKNIDPTFSSSGVTKVNSVSVYSYAITTSDADGEGATVIAPTKPVWLLVFTFFLKSN